VDVMTGRVSSAVTRGCLRTPCSYGIRVQSQCVSTNIYETALSKPSFYQNISMFS